MYEIFSAVSFSPESSPADGKIVYNIWNWQDDYKRSKDAAVSLNLALPKLQLALDNAILSVIAKETNSALSPKLTANLKWMEPYNIEQSSSSTSSGESYQQFGMMGLASAFYAFAFFPLLTYISSTVLYEKTNKLLGPIRRMGLMESAYWMSALFFAMMCSLVASSVFSLSVYLTGQHYDVGFFKKIDISILWIVCFLYAIGISSFGLLISSMFSRNMFILLIQSLVLISFFVVGFLGVFTSFQPLLHGEAFDLFRAFIPWLSFQKFISDSYVQLSFVKFNQSITWSNITTPLINSRLDREAKEYKIVNSFDNLGSMVFVYQVLAIFTVFILTWYFAQVLNTEEGFSLRWNFPFTSEYWTGKNVNSGNKVMDVNDTAERERALSEEEQSIRTMKISKTYKGTAAVKELTLQMQKGNIYSLLGHNGSGKTTTIGLLSGVTEPTFGEAFVLGHDVRKEMRSIASKTGNCNQFDLLYPFLTAYQHFVFYAKFRSVRLDALQSLDEYIFEKLKTVDLDDVAHKPVGGFSGGMKRRLSLMLSTVGNDLELLFLDEPTVK